MKKIIGVVLFLCVCGTAFAEDAAQTQNVQTPEAVKETTAQTEAPKAEEQTGVSMYLSGNFGAAMSIQSHGKEFKDSSAVMGGVGLGLGLADIARAEVAFYGNSISQDKQPGATQDVTIDTSFVMCNLFLDMSKPGVSGPYVGVGVGSADTELNLPTSSKKYDIGQGTATALYLGYGIAVGKQAMIDLGIDYFSWTAEKKILGVNYKADLDQFNIKAGFRWYFI